MKQNSYLLAITLILFSLVALGKQDGGAPLMEKQAKVKALPSHFPKVPVVLDGVPYEVGELPSNEPPRFYVLTKKDQRKGIVHAFSSQESADAFMRVTMAKEAKEAKERGTTNLAQEGNPNPDAFCQNPFIYTRFNKDRGDGGSANLLMVWPDLYPNLDFDGWNNRISFVAAACNGFPTAIYSCRNFELNRTFACETPGRFLIQSGMIIPDLEPYGWNNRTSATKFGF